MLKICIKDENTPFCRISIWMELSWCPVAWIIHSSYGTVTSQAYEMPSKNPLHITPAKLASEYYSRTYWVNKGFHLINRKVI